MRLRPFAAAFLVAAPVFLAVPSGARAEPLAYIPNVNDSSASIIDLGLVPETPVIQTASVLTPAHQVVVNPLGNRVYFGDVANAAITARDSTTFQLQAFSSLAGPPFLGPPQGMAINDTGTRLYVSVGTSLSLPPEQQLQPLLLVLDAKTGAVLGQAVVGDYPYRVAFDPVNKHVYVTHLQPAPGSVEVLDVSSDTPSAVVGSPIPVGDGPTGIAVSPAGDRVYVASFSSQTLSVIDTALNTVIATVPENAHDVAVNTALGSATFGHVFVTGVNGAVIDEFDANGAFLQVFGAITPPPSPESPSNQGISVSPDGLTLLVVNTPNNAVEKYPIPNPPSAPGVPAPGQLIPVGNNPVALGNFIGPSVIKYTPRPPQNGAATLTGIQGQVKVSWDPPNPTPGATAVPPTDPPVSSYTYTVFSTQGSPVHVSGITGTSVTLTGLPNGLSVALAVIASSVNGDGALADQIPPVMPLATVPDPPTNVTALVTGRGQVTVSYTPPANNGGEAIGGYIATSSPDGLNGLDTTGTGAPIVVMDLTLGTHYTFAVAAHNPVGDGAFSAPSNDVVPTDTPQPPVLVRTTGGDQQVSVEFTPPVDTGGLPILSYTVTASPGGMTATGTASPIVVTGLTNLTPYTFTVTASNMDGPSNPSNPSNPTQPFQPPAPPTGVTAAVSGSGRITVDCTASASPGDAPGGIEGYMAIASPGPANVTGAACPLTFSGLTAGTSYTFTVVAVTASGPSAPSAPSSAVIAAVPPDAPTGVTASQFSASTAQVSFTPPANDGFAPVTSYIVRSSPAVTPLTVAASPAIMPGLTLGTTYTFTVTALNAAGESLLSAPSNSITLAETAVTEVLALPGDGNAMVRFTPPASSASPITSFTVASSPGGINASVDPAPTAVHVRVTGLTNGTTYTFTVTTHHMDGSSETTGASNPVTPARLPPRNHPWAYVTSEDDDFVTVIDTSTDQAINTIEVGIAPDGVVASPDGTHVYTANADSVSVIDAASQSVVATIPVAGVPFALAVNPAGTRLYSTNESDATMSVIDTASNTVIATVPLPGSPLGIDVDHGGNSIYVSFPFGHNIVRIDAATNTIAETSAPLGIGPAGIEAATSNLVYLADFFDGQVATLSGVTQQSVTAFPDSEPGGGIVMDPADGNVYFTRDPGGPSGTVNRLAGGSAPVGASPVGIAVTPTGSKLYVTNIAGNSVSVIDATTMTPLATIPVGNKPVSFGRFIAPPDANPPRLGAISTRMRVLTGDNVLIGGFAIGGSTPKTVVVRARGPSLAAAGVASPLSNPFLQLVFADGTVLANDDWQSAGNAADIMASGFAPSDPRESVVMTTLAPGLYTAIVSGAGGATGVGLVEVFEVDHPDIPLAGISTRGEVLTGDDVMIGGVIIQGDAPQTVIVRARGPSLAAQGIANPLSNPLLQLVASDGTVITNDDWGSAPNYLQIQASGFAPSDPRESAILVTLNPGAYTAIVSGVGGSTGVAIVEVFAQ